MFFLVFNCISLAFPCFLFGFSSFILSFEVFGPLGLRDGPLRHVVAVLRLGGARWIAAAVGLPDVGPQRQGGLQRGPEGLAPWNELNLLLYIFFI